AKTIARAMEDLGNSSETVSKTCARYVLTPKIEMSRLAAVDNENREEREEQQRPMQSAPKPKEASRREDDAPREEQASSEPYQAPPEGNPTEAAAANATDDAGAPATSDQRPGGGSRRPRRHSMRDRRGRDRGRRGGRDRGGRDREREPRPAYASSQAGPEESRGTRPADLPQDEQGARRVSLLRETREQVERIREVL